MTQEQIDYIESEEFVEGFRCLELEVPWMVPGAIYKLEEVLRKDDIVCEVGMGGSTIFFAKRCIDVCAFDTDDRWAARTKQAIEDNNLLNASYNVIPSKEEMEELFKTGDQAGVTVFSVDPQGGVNRSKILNYFLYKGISKHLRIIILDNYGHEGIFPDHWNRIIQFGADWEVFTYDHPRWAGSGTRIYVKKEK